MVDESGEWGKLSEYYLITLVFHDQSEPISPHVERYEQHLADASLPNIPFHAGPLLNGHDDYEALSMADRKRLFVAFFTLARNLPFTYVTFEHRKSKFGGDKNRFAIWPTTCSRTLTGFSHMTLSKSITTTVSRSSPMRCRHPSVTRLPRTRSSTVRPIPKTIVLSKPPISCAPSN